MSACILIAVFAMLLAPGFGAEEPKLLLLDNGQVIEGKIRSEYGNYVVIKDSGSRIVFPADRVELVCSDWNDLYWQRCAMLKASDTAGHLRLFHWCIKHDLIDGAQNQIDLLQYMNVSASQLQRLDQQLANTRLLISQRLKQRAQELVRQADAVAEGRKDFQVKPVAYEQSASVIRSVPRKFDEAVMRQPSRADEIADAKQLTETKENAVDPFDPEEFNRLYVRKSDVENRENLKSWPSKRSSQGRLPREGAAQKNLTKKNAQ